MKTLIGYVVKVGDEYATGCASDRSASRNKAHVFGLNDYKLAQDHCRMCHEGGRVVRLVCVTNAPSLVQKLNKLEDRVFALELAKSQESARVAKLVKDELFEKFSRLTLR